MQYLKRSVLAITAVSAIFFSSCHSDTDNKGMNENAGTNTSTGTRKISVIISSIPFPSGILDTMQSAKATFKADITNPASNMNLYSESNAQAANLGIYGADLAYVISFEQFQSVGIYMKSTKFLADNIGIPLAFTQQVIERCEKNQNNKDSLTQIVFQSYGVIDQTLKQSQRNASEVLVLMGGWIEGAYLTTESLSTVPDSNKKKVYEALLQQKQYVDKLITLLNEVSSTPYCKQIIPQMQEVKAAFEPLVSVASFTKEKFSALNEKINNLRSQIIKGNS